MRVRKVKRLPRVPLEGSLDLTYRCNNICRHCWLWLSPKASEERDELSFDEIRHIADQARAMGTRNWSISGGEPMIREDFPEIFDYLTRGAAEYSLNTNGTLITPEIARLLKRRGLKMIALYGATPDVYDAVTNHPGGFDALMQGIAYLKEASVNFVVQLIPMRDNWHQWEKMLELARNLSPEYRLGAAWLHLSHSNLPNKNLQIIAQRLDAKDVISISRPLLHKQPSEIDKDDKIENSCDESSLTGSYLYASCIENRSEYHIDPYGGMSFCAIIKDPRLRFSLREHSFQEIWDDLIPSSAKVIVGDEEYHQHCGTCEKRKDCRWCAAYSYLETGRHTAPIPYLCQIADEIILFKQDWRENHRRYFNLAGISICVESDVDLSKIVFTPELMAFAADGPGEDEIVLSHHFEIPKLSDDVYGKVVYRKDPWVISYEKRTWFYRGVLPKASDRDPYQLAIFNEKHTHGDIYSRPQIIENVASYGWRSLSLMSTDQIWFIPLLADRQAVLMHSGAVLMNGGGLIFIGHSEAGKSTTMTMLRDAGIRNPNLDIEILCDDRNIIRKWDDGWKVHGTWSHGDVSDVSSASAPLKAIMFLQQDKENVLIRLTDRRDILGRLLETLIRSLETTEWWQKELEILGKIACEVPCFVMKFDKSGKIINDLSKLVE